MRIFLHEPEFFTPPLNKLNRRLFKGSGGGGSSTQTVQNYSPEEAANRSQIQNTAEQLYKQTAKKIGESPYPGAQVVPLNQDQLTGQNLTRTAANTMASQYLPQLGEATKFGLSDVLDVNSNPYLQSAISASVRPITESYTDAGGVMSSIRNNSIANGGQGNSTRQGVAEGIAAGRYAQAIGDTASRVTSDAYGKGLDTFSRIYGLTPQTMQATTMPGTAYGAVGQQNQNMAQAQENYLGDSRNWDLNSGWIPLQNWANIVYGAGSSGSTTSTSGSGTQSGGAAGALGGAMSGAQLGSMFGPMGTGIGAIGGAVLGGLF
ncbi:hypothetical protein [Methylocaldum sp.]|uniref:hypothetical protein n=1 Tax=Methylocaldum sp. TaxID=1969727 RepID=UPI002D3890C4|nr:hypothetical protein [Methylocaldum sp.]HYE38160.1 hypothetical protein [Methylocaldum sp.]